MKRIITFADLLNESEILIDLDKKETELSHIKRYGKMDLTKVNRLTHLLYNFDYNGSPLVGEKIAELLLNAVNLNYFNKSYPFVDLKVKEPIEGMTVKDEFISIKTSSTKHSLSSAITDVNGFKISQLILFVMNFLADNQKPFNIFKSDIFKDRNAIRKDMIVTVYYRFMKAIDKIAPELYDHLFLFQLYYIILLSRYIETLRIPKKQMIENTNDFYSMLFGIVLTHVNSTFNKDYRREFEDALEDVSPRVYLSDSLIKQFSSMSFPNVNLASYLPSKVAEMRVSYCMIYFEPDVKGKVQTEEVVLHLQKTRSLSILDLLDRSINLWKDRGFHKKETRDKNKENIYFNFQDIVKIFEEDKISQIHKSEKTGRILKSDVEFDTHLKVIINKENIRNFSERPEKQTDLIVKVIDEIKGLPSDELTTKVLKDINKITNLMKIHNQRKKENFVDKFREFMHSLNQKDSEDRTEQEETPEE